MCRIPTSLALFTSKEIAGPVLVVLKRTRVHAPLLVAFLGTSMVLCALVAGVLGLIEGSMDDGARAVLSQHSGSDLALRASLDLADDPDHQDGQVRSALSRSLRGAVWSVVGRPDRGRRHRAHGAEPGRRRSSARGHRDERARSAGPG